jgi:hypothetical protein
MNSWAHTGNNLRASGSSILPKHPLKAIWNSLSNSVQNTNLGPSIYRLTGNLKLLRFGHWLASVRTEVSLVRMVLCDILSETAQFYLYQVLVRTAWPSVRTVFAKIFSSFERNSRIFWNTGHRPDVLPRHPDDFPNSVDFWNPTPCWILIDLASGRCCSDVFIVICWKLRGVRTPSKARSNDCTGTGYFCLGFCKGSSWTSLRSMWSVIVFDLIIVWIHEDS